MKIYAVWPCNKNGVPGGSWRQSTRWLVIDVTAGLDDVEIVFGPTTRARAIDHELGLRVAQRAAGSETRQ